jgi:hypothetical protein
MTATATATATPGAHALAPVPEPEIVQPRPAVAAEPEPPKSPVRGSGEEPPQPEAAPAPAAAAAAAAVAAPLSPLPSAAAAAAAAAGASTPSQGWMSAFQVFQKAYSQQARKELEAQRPGVTLMIGDIQGGISSKWKSLSDAERQPYEDVSREQKRKHAERAVGASLTRSGAPFLRVLIFRLLSSFLGRLKRIDWLRRSRRREEKKEMGKSQGLGRLLKGQRRCLQQAPPRLGHER